MVVQDAKDEDEALSLAWDNISFGDFEIDEVKIEQELTTEEDLNHTVRYAQQVI
jgi:hypothetical protein